MNKLQMVVLKKLSSSPVSDPEILAAAEACVPRPTKGEVSLQKLYGTDVYEWHSRTGMFWNSDGNYMVLEEKI